MDEAGMYIKLYHGRLHPDEDLETWGIEGPVLGPYHWFVSTYLYNLRAGTKDDSIENEFTFIEDMVYYDGKYYGDFQILLGAGLTEDEKKLIELYDYKKSVRIQEKVL